MVPVVSQSSQLPATLLPALASSIPVSAPAGIGSRASTLQSASSSDPSSDKNNYSTIMESRRSNAKQVEMIAAIVKPFLEKWHVAPSSKDTFYHAGSDDFGVVIEELLLSNCPISTRTEVKADSHIKNLKEIASKLGFDLTLTPIQYMVRDCWIPIPGGFAVPAYSENVQKAVERARSVSLLQHSNAMFCSTHEYYSASLGAVNKYLCAGSLDLDSSLKGLPSLPFYLEGGNHYQVFLKGQKKVIIGIDFLYIILNQFRLDKQFDEPSIAAAAKQIEETLTREQIKQVLPEMYAQGLLKEKKGCSKGFISEEGIFSIVTEIYSDVHLLKDKVSPPEAYLDEAKRQGLFSPLDLNEQEIDNSRNIVARYLAQMTAVKQIIAQTFGVSAEDLIFLLQAGYHLDMFMRPGPDESFFVQDYQCTYELLQLIESKRGQLQLTLEDLEILKRYSQTAQTLQVQLKPLLQSIREKLTAAGFTVIPTPGVFYDATPLSINPLSPFGDRTFNVNFINAITGYSPKTARYYYMTGGAESGMGRLGHVLMDAFREFLHSYGNIDLHYVGEDPDMRGNFLESWAWMNILGRDAGIHCFATERKTASHSPYADLD